MAKTTKGKLNYLVDAYFDEKLKNPFLDELAHFLVEYNYGSGTPEERLSRWAKKFGKYGMKRLERIRKEKLKQRV